MIKYETLLESHVDDYNCYCRTLRGDTTSLQLDTVWKELQTHVDHVIDK